MIAREQKVGISTWLITGITVLSAAGLVVLIHPSATQYAKSRADSLVMMASRELGAAAQLDYRIANILDPTNEPAAVAVAQSEFESGNTIKAGSTLEAASAGRGTKAAYFETCLKVHAEQLDYNYAAKDADSLVSIANLSDDQAVLAAIGWKLDGQGTKVDLMLGRTNSLKAASKLKQIQSGDLPFARILAASGLVRSSKDVLNNAPSSAQKYLLRSRLLMLSDKKIDRVDAASDLGKYLSYVPDDIDARAMYISLLDPTDQAGLINSQKSLNSRLKSGQP